ncbi:hypothetical protein FQN53_003199 [Emmonsiellopsis sp. PD_33]|nr:hypothetical protein FQN53_003199 [Emmonsiellopsis sp. PD_33]
MPAFLPVNSVPTSIGRMIDGAATGSSSSTTPHGDPSRIPQQGGPLPPSSPHTSTDHERDSGYGTVSAESEKRSNHSPTASNTTSTGSPPATHSREGSSVQSSVPEENPVADSEGDHEGSDNDTDMGDAAPPSKKKKGQRFPAVPIELYEKRTFSSPYKHAQTVHVNEDIPGDSLAATGTRFQRQIRTDRVRPQGRARAGTGGSQGGHGRGHSRNLSTSSIASTVSTFSQTQEIRRRPPPLMMADDGSARARLTLETMNSPPRTPPGQMHGFSGHSPGSALFTPTSATYYGSPASSNPGFWDERGHARRLSVPSGTRPFEPASSYPPPFPRPLAPSNSSFSNNGSMFGSPTTAHTPQDESAAEADWRRRTWHPSTQGFNRPATSGLWFNQSADRPEPAFGSNAPPAQNAPPRLPGIESFDQVQGRPSAPPRREPTPMQVDSTGSQPPTSGPGPAFAPGFGSQAPTARPAPPISGPGHRRGHVSFDMSLHRNLTKLDIRGNSSSGKDASQWSQQTIGELQSIGSRPFGSFQQQPQQHPPPQEIPRTHPHEQPAGPSSTGPTTPTQNKRHGWYNGPLATTTPTSHPAHMSPEDSSSSEGVATPSASAPEYHPAIVPSHGDIEGHHSHAQTEASNNVCAPQPQNNAYSMRPNPEPRSPFYSGNPSHPAGGMARLEALVAVATSEDKAGKFF